MTVTAESTQAKLMEQAIKDATTAVKNHTVLAGTAAHKAAAVAVKGAEPRLATLTAVRLANLEPRTALLLAGIAVTTLLVDVVTLTAVAVAGNRKTRAAAAAGVALHVTTAVLARRFRAKQTAAARAVLAREAA